MSNKTAKSTLTHAQEYLLRDGFSVIPVSHDKRPNLPSWQKYQDALPTEQQINDWFTTPGNNIAIITGSISGITVVDLDTHKPGTPSLAMFPKTLTIKTGNGGYHLYYKYTDAVYNSANLFPHLPHVDIRNDGGYVLAPPSITKYKNQDHEIKGGPYTIHTDAPIADFPTHLFFPKSNSPAPKGRANKKPKFNLQSKVALQEGSRNDSLTSVIGKLLQATPDISKWESDIWPTVIAINDTYTPPLPINEVKTIFHSIAKKEEKRLQGLIESPFVFDSKEMLIPIAKGHNGQPFKDMANICSILTHAPQYKDMFQYNTFTHEVEYRKQRLTDEDILAVQWEMQTNFGMRSVSKDVIESAIVHVAQRSSYDEAQDWLTSLTWDGVPRLHEWLAVSTNIPNDDYHTAIGMNWIMGMVRRIMEPGCFFDYVLTLIGPQGTGKTSLFRIIGGKYYKSYSGSMDDKDFLMVLRGALLVDLDEGASMYKSLAIKIKSMITLTHDEYRAPYARTIKKYPRRFVFSMSTNDDEPFRDTTGNRRYWTVDLGEDMINFKWLEEAREQLFAEAYHIYKNKLDLPDVPMDIAQAKQLDHLGEDPWTELVQKYLNKELDYVQGKAYFQTSIIDIYGTLFGEDKLDRLNRPTEMRMATILKHLGFYKKRVQYGGERKSCWRLGPKKIRELKEAYENSLDPNYKPEGEDAEDNPQPRKSIDDQFNEF